MDVYSELEVEILAQEMQLDGQGLEPEIISIADDPALQAELTQAEQLLNGEQAFDPYALEWLGDFSVPEDSQTIEPSTGEWLTEFMDVDAPSQPNPTIGNDKLSVLFSDTPDHDELISTGTINTSWDYSDILDFLATLESMGDGILVEDEDGPEIPDRWKMKPPETPTSGVQVDRDGPTIPDNQDTDEQEATEDLLADLWTVLWGAEGGDATVEWGSEYNEDTGQYHVFPLPPLVG